MLGLVGALGLVAAYWMPWFGTQGLLLSGAFLNEFLSSTPDLRRVMPGATGGPQEAQQLRALVLLFPATGTLGAIVALAAGLTPGRNRFWGLLLAVIGGVPLIALLVGLGRLPPGSTFEAGLWTIGLGAACMCVGGGFEWVRSSGSD